MMAQTPRSASDFYQGVAAEKVAALESVRRSWRRMSSEFDLSWQTSVGPAVLAATVQAQDRVAEAAGVYVPRVLRETGQAVPGLEWEPDPRAWGGTAGDGRSVQSLTYGAVTHAKSAVAGGAAVNEALAAGGVWLTQAVGTVIADTARSAEVVHARGRRKPMYVRMLNPPSCGRCIILAGQTYYTAFERHPGCDCLSIPASENVAGDLLTDPSEYLGSLDDEGLRKALGSKANAAAYREGADVNQLVNAYRRSGDVAKAQVYGRTVKYTIEGTTRRGWAHQSMRQARYIRDAGETRGQGRYMRLKAPRLMPETIFEIAGNRAEARRLLKLYGWIL